MEFGVALTHTMVINTIGQLARGITFAYKLHWKGVSVYNIDDHYIVRFGP